MILLSLPDSTVVEAVVARRGRHPRGRPRGPGPRRPEHRPTRARRRAGGAARRSAASRCSTPASPAAPPPPRRARSRSWSAATPTRSSACARVLECFSERIVPHGRGRVGPRDEAAQQLPQRGDARRDRGGDGRGAASPGSTCARVLDVINSSSGVSFASLNRFPHIIEGDYLEGGLTSRLMLKDVTLYLEMLRELGAPSLNVAGPMASFGLALGSATATRSATASSTPSATSPAACGERGLVSVASTARAGRGGRVHRPRQDGAADGEPPGGGGLQGPRLRPGRRGARALAEAGAVAASSASEAAAGADGRRADAALVSGRAGRADRWRPARRARHGRRR